MPRLTAWNSTNPLSMTSGPGFPCAMMIIVVHIIRGAPSMKEISTVGIDLPKSIFQTHADDDTGARIVQRTLRPRSQTVGMASLKSTQPTPGHYPAAFQINGKAWTTPTMPPPKRISRSGATSNSGMRFSHSSRVIWISLRARCAPGQR